MTEAAADAASPGPGGLGGYADGSHARGLDDGDPPQSQTQRAVQRFERLFMALPLPAVVIDGSGVVQIVNPAMQVRMGLDHQPAGRRSFLHLVRPGDDRNRLKLGLSRATAQGQAEVPGVRLDLRGGRETRVCDVHVQHLAPLQDDTSDTAFVLMLFDQTEQLRSINEFERTHRELLAKERENLMLGEAARLSGQLIIVTDASRRLVWVNPAFENLTGHKQADVLGRRPHDLLIGPDTERAACNAIESRLSEGLGVEQAELLCYSRQGKPFWLLMDIRPLPVESQLGGGHITVATEITERRRIEDAVRTSESRLTAIFETVPSAVMLVDPAGLMARWNRAAAALLHIEPGAPMALSHCIAPDERPLFEGALQSASMGASPSLRHGILSAQGKTVTVHTQIVPVLDTLGTQGLVVVMRDLSAELEADRLRAEKEVAEAASRAKTDFIARMSHELRTPLNAILGFAQLMTPKGGTSDLPVGHHSHVGHIIDAGWHLLAMIDDVLDLSRVEAHQLHIECRPMALRDAIEAALAMVHSAAQAKGIQIDHDTESTGAVTVDADPVRLNQILINLLTNAVKYNHEGGQLRVRAAVEGSMVQVCLANTGEGLNAEQRAHLFEPFNRLGAERGRQPGTGIGLVIARGLAQQMGGSLSVKPLDGSRWTTFLLELPAAELDSTAGLARELQDGPVARADATGALSTSRVLYVEDDEINALLITTIIERRLGWPVEVVRTGAEGFRRARVSRPDVLLLDLQLPDMSGLDLARALMAEAPELTRRLAILTADATDATRQRLHDAGVRSVLHKPVDMEALVNLVSALAGEHVAI